MSKQSKNFKLRPAGVALPVASLPSRYGIGDFGPAAKKWIDWLVTARQRYWQILPLTIPDSLGSPYASSSAMAGNWLLISPENLAAAGLLPRRYRRPWSSPASRINYRLVTTWKRSILKLAWRQFLRRGTRPQHQAWITYQRLNRSWLGDFCLYQAIKDWQRGKPWWRWPAAWRRYPGPAIKPQYIQRGIAFHQFVQWQWHEQWQSIRRYAHRRGIKIIGDIPFYVPHDSVDVWAHPDLFDLNRTGWPNHVAGVPPDRFACDGQRWGEPVYHWAAHQHSKFHWWRRRWQQARARYDLIRFDHFVGLVSTWHIPARAKTARTGQWVQTPGRELLNALRRDDPSLPLIAEDLGHQTDAVAKLRQHFHVHGSRIMEFGWSGTPDNPHAPWRVTKDTVYMTSNHDLPPLQHWWRTEATAAERQLVKNHFRSGASPTLSDWMTDLYRTPAAIAIVPVQDILRLSSKSRINRPGTKRGNWQWRLPPRLINKNTANNLKKLITTSGIIKSEQK